VEQFLRAWRERMKALIIAAGQGTRLSSICPVKPLLPVLQKPLIDWVVKALIWVKVEEVVVVTGYEADKVEAHLLSQSWPGAMEFIFVRNEEWQKENGLSVIKARSFLNEPFFLLMADHIFDPEILILLKNQPIKENELILAVDATVQNHPCVDLDDVTRVKVENGLIRNIGKGLSDYNAFDTGIFYCSPALFAALEESQRRRRNFTLSGGVLELALKEQARALDVSGRFWIDVDDEKAWKKAEDYLRRTKLQAGP
jgi:choline kinase